MSNKNSSEKKKGKIEIDDPTPYILNENNILITSEFIEGVLKKYKVKCKIKNIEFFQKAMVHPSYLIRDENYYKNNKSKYDIYIDPIDDVSKAIPLQKESYERLEFLGDSVIHLILATYFFNRYENQNEGFMTRLRTKIENGETLAQLSKAIGLNRYILLSRYIDKNGGRDNNLHILEDSFEAFMGALYLEIGFDNCKTFLINLMEQEVDFAQILHTETNYKDLLLQFFHQRKWRDPCYGVLDISGSNHHKQFTMYVKCKKTQFDDGEIVGIGVSTSKKNAEQLCARNALIHFGLLKDGDESDSETIEEISDEEINNK